LSSNLKFGIFEIMKLKKYVIILIFLFILFFDSSKIIFSNEFDNGFIYKSPIDDSEFFQNCQKFVTYNENIYSINDSFLIEISRYYIPTRKIKIRKSQYSITTDGIFLYLINNNGKLYRFDGKKIRYFKNLSLNSVLDFEIFNDEFYILTKNSLITIDSKNYKKNEMLKFENSFYKKIKVIKNKVYLLNNYRLDTFDLSGKKIDSFENNIKYFSFDIDIDGKIYLLSSEKILIINNNVIEDEIKVDKEVKDIFFDLSRNLVLYYYNYGVRVLPVRYNFDTLNISKPRDLTIDENENIYVLCSNNVSVFNKNLKFLYSFGENLINFPSSIYYYDNKLFVSDSWNSKVRVFNKNGKELYNFGIFGEEDNQFINPNTIKIINNKIFVLDTYNHKLKVFDMNGNFLNSYGKSPIYFFMFLIKPKDIFLEPIDFTYLNDELFILEKNGEVKVYGEKFKLIKNSNKETYLKAFTFNNNIYLLGNRRKIIYQIKDDKVIPKLSIFTKSFLKITPFSFYINDNFIYLVDFENGKVYRIYGSL